MQLVVTEPFKGGFNHYVVQGLLRVSGPFCNGGVFGIWYDLVWTKLKHLNPELSKLLRG